MYLGKLGLNGICDAVQRYKALLTVVTCYYYALVLLDILGAYLNSQRNALHLVLSKLPAGRVVAVIDLYSDACCLEDICHLVSLVENALLELLDRNDNCLNGCYCGRKNKSVVVAVGHDNCADKTGGHAPRSLVRIYLLIVLVGEHDIECLCKTVTEIVGGSCLESLAVVHKSLYCVGCNSACKLIALGLSALYNGHCKVLLAELSIYVQHTLGLFDSLLSCCVNGMTLLPEELS